MTIAHLRACLFMQVLCSAVCWVKIAFTLRFYVLQPKKWGGKRASSWVYFFMLRGVLHANNPLTRLRAVCEIKSHGWQVWCCISTWVWRVTQQSHSFEMPDPLYAWIIIFKQFHHIRFSGWNMHYAFDYFFFFSSPLWKRLKLAKVWTQWSQETRVQYSVDIYLWTVYFQIGILYLVQLDRMYNN